MLYITAYNKNLILLLSYIFSIHYLYIMFKFSIMSYLYKLLINIYVVWNINYVFASI